MRQHCTERDVRARSATYEDACLQCHHTANSDKFNSTSSPPRRAGNKLHARTVTQKLQLQEGSLQLAMAIGEWLVMPSEVYEFSKKFIALLKARFVGHTLSLMHTYQVTWSLPITTAAYQMLDLRRSTMTYASE